MDFWRTLAQTIEHASGQPFRPRQPRHVGGGCINQTLRLEDGRQSWFVKINDAARLAMFEAEREGLEALAKAGCIRVPRPLCCGVIETQSYLVLENIEMGTRPSAHSEALAGQQLALLHQQQARRFGWHRDNTIGSTHQPNRWHERWVDFWYHERLGFQLEEARRNGYGGQVIELGERLMEHLPALLNHAPSPSLLHGDLWGGNLSFDRQGQPVIYDPATYYGDREAEIAMTELFGGFGRNFYAAYEETWPLPPEYAQRKTLYNLYHILNHMNMFGGGYHGQAVRMMQTLLAAVR